MPDSLEQEEMSDEKILEQLKGYVQVGALKYVLPTEPLGEAWVLGYEDGILKFNTKDEVMAFLAGADMVLRRLMVNKQSLRSF